MNNLEVSKIVMQKTAKKQEEYIVNQIKLNIPNDWSYINFCNGEEELFFKQNSLDEFPDIIEKWRQMPCQPHKADLFRYYYLYIYGGFFLDGDAMIYDNIENIINNNNFVTAIGLDTSTLCNAYIGTFPKNPIIYEALKDAYNIDVSKFMNNYDLLCKNLYNIVHKTKYHFKIKLYKEYDNVRGESAKVINDNGNIIIVHYYKYKIIPTDKNVFNNNEITIVIGPCELPIKLIKLERPFTNPTFILGSHPYNDAFEFIIKHNILIVTRIDNGHGWGYNHTVIIKDNN
jgi:hypothetical protein